MNDNTSGWAGWWWRNLPKIVLSPSFAITLCFVYGFIIYTGYISMTASRMLLKMKYIGLDNYEKLWKTLNWPSIPWLWRVSGKVPDLSWQCFWLAYAESMVNKLNRFS